MDRNPKWGKNTQKVYKKIILKTWDQAGEISQWVSVHALQTRGGGLDSIAYTAWSPKTAWSVPIVKFKEIWTN